MIASSSPELKPPNVGELKSDGLSAQTAAMSLWRVSFAARNRLWLHLKLQIGKLAGLATGISGIDALAVFRRRCVVCLLELAREIVGVFKAGLKRDVSDCPLCLD